MNHCKYHPLQGATYYCAECDIPLCDICVDDDPKHRHKIRCWNCAKPLESLGAANVAEPFWRRLQAAFKYPLNSSSMSLVVGMSLVSVVAVLLAFLPPLAIVLSLFAAGALLKYSFTCMEQTAMGEMTAPDVMAAYQGGIKLLLQLFVLCLAFGLILTAIAHYMGLGIASFFGFILLISAPAILIRFAQTESIFAALNPLGALALITAIGMPYGLLIGFVVIMMSSVAVLHELIGNFIPSLSLLLQSIVSNYYTLVVFHLMGYMLFQYQHKLGYSARAEEEEPASPRTDMDRLLARIEVLLKEGNYEQMIDLYFQAFRQYPNEPQFFDKYFEFLYACKKAALMEDFALPYLEFVLRKKRYDKLAPVYRQMALLVPNLVPANPSLRLELARLFRQQGDVKTAIKMLNGLHKSDPQFADLIAAYRLMAMCLEESPGLQVQAQKCLQLVAQLEKCTAQQQLEREAAKVQIGGKVNSEFDAQKAAATAPKSKRIPPQQAAAPKREFALELVPLETSPQDIPKISTEDE